MPYPIEIPDLKTWRAMRQKNQPAPAEPGPPCQEGQETDEEQARE